jgi:rRNA methylase
MWLRLIMVGPEGPVNLGYVARLAENFEVDELALVSPQASIAESLRWAARGSSRLLEVAVYPSLYEALKDVDLSICTSDESSARDVLRTARDARGGSRGGRQEGKGRSGPREGERRPDQRGAVPLRPPLHNTCVVQVHGP